jgi:hypothetical protein
MRCKNHQLAAATSKAIAAQIPTIRKRMVFKADSIEFTVTEVRRTPRI